MVYKRWELSPQKPKARGTPWHLPEPEIRAVANPWNLADAEASLVKTRPDKVRLVLRVPAADLNPLIAYEVLLGFWNLGIPLVLDVSATYNSIETAVICEGQQSD